MTKKLSLALTTLGWVPEHHSGVKQMTFTPSELREMRRDNGWTQARLAGLAGVNQATISLCEAGAYAPGAHTLRAIERALGLPINYWSGSK